MLAKYANNSKLGARLSGWRVASPKFLEEKMLTRILAAACIAIACIVGLTGIVGLSGCGNSVGTQRVGTQSAATLPAPDGQGHPGPAAGAKRAGISYDVTIKAADGNDIAFTVHEPTELVGGTKVPLLLTGPGFAGTRTNATQRGQAQYIDAGYGVISFDQRGFGGSTGTVSIMDPDKDGPNLVQIVDWAESNLDWLQYRDNSLVLGTYGGSYGGGFQLLLNNVDPRHRLKAMVPYIAWNDLAYSLGVGDTPKTTYSLILIGAGEASGRLNMDPFVLAALKDSLLNNRLSDSEYAELHYRGNAYFCDGVSQPGKRPATHPPKVDALFLQGMNDVLFNFNEGKANYDCLSASGGDVRLFTSVLGHVLPAGLTLLPLGEPTPGQLSIADYTRCGPWANDALTKLWFDAKLKRDATAITEIAKAPNTCINLGANGEGVVVDAVKVGGSGDIAVPVTPVLELLPVPVTVPLFTATETTVVAGIPTATLKLENVAPASGLPGGLPLGISTDDAIIYVSIGVSRNGVVPAALEILGDQIRPVRGFGTQTLQLHGIGVKLNAGDQLQLVIAGQALTQYPLIVAHNPLLPIVNVSGTVQVPVLGNVATVK